DAATAALDLDFFVLFSSISAALGSPTLADYATGNAFMDEFASIRNELALAGKRRGHCVAIDWPVWKEGGMSGGASGDEWLRKATGMQPLTTATGLRALYRSLELGCAQALVMAGEAERIERFFAAHLEGRAEAVAPTPARGVNRSGGGDARRAALVQLLK